MSADSGVVNTAVCCTGLTAEETVCLDESYSMLLRDPEHPVNVPVKDTITGNNRSEWIH